MPTRAVLRGISCTLDIFNGSCSVYFNNENSVAALPFFVQRVERQFFWTSLQHLPRALERSRAFVAYRCCSGWSVPFLFLWPFRMTVLWDVKTQKHGVANSFLIDLKWSDVFISVVYSCRVPVLVTLFDCNVIISHDIFIEWSPNHHITQDLATDAAVAGFPKFLRLLGKQGGHVTILHFPWNTQRYYCALVF